VAKRLPQCLPAHLLLCAFRFFDHTGDDEGLTGLFNAFHASLKEHIVDTKCELDSLSLWLVSCWRLLHLLHYYGSNDSCANGVESLKNYDLGPVREQLAYRVDELYSNLMKKAIEPLLLPKVVPALLQHESWELQQLLHNGTSHSNGNGEQRTRRGDELGDLLEFVSF